MKLFPRGAPLFAAAAALLAILPASAAPKPATIAPTSTPILMRGAALGQLPQVFITWRANTYSAPGYAGKDLPSAKSVIHASVQVIDQGTIADLRNLTIYWYMGTTDFISGGVGAVTTDISAGDAVSDVLPLRVEVQGYKGQTLEGNVDVPVVPPVVVIDSPFPGNFVFTPKIHLEALPYFFNVSGVSKLSYTWTVNGEPPSNVENPETLDITLPDNTTSNFGVDVSLTAKSVLDDLQSDTDARSITYIPNK